MVVYEQLRRPWDGGCITPSLRLPKSPQGPRKSVPHFKRLIWLRIAARPDARPLGSGDRHEAYRVEAIP